MTVRNYVDNSPTTNLTSAITSGATSATVNSLTGFPASFPYIATLGLGTSSAEVVLVTAAVGTTLTITRNYDGQGAFSHPINETFDHTAAAKDFQEANSHINASTVVHGITGAVVGTTDTQTLTNKTLNGATLDNFSQIGGVSGLTLSSAWTTYTPTFTNLTGAAGSFAYKLIGKRLSIRGAFTAGTVTATGSFSVSLPASLTAAGPSGAPQFLVGQSGASGTGASLWQIVGTGGSNTITTGGNVTGGNSLVGLGFTGVIEVL